VEALLVLAYPSGVSVIVDPRPAVGSHMCSPSGGTDTTSQCTPIRPDFFGIIAMQAFSGARLK
jgi:hypothetical protein